LLNRNGTELGTTNIAVDP